MEPKLEIDKGWTEAIIDKNCEFDKFYTIANVLSTHFNLSFSNKLNDFDSLYWDFKYKDNELVLHYNIYFGVTIFPKALKSATKKDNLVVIEISTLLINLCQSLNFDKDKSQICG